MSGLLPAEPTLTGLLRAAQAEPEDDDTSRLVLADYLDERGDPRGAMIRASCVVARRQLCDPGWYDQTADLEHLEARLLPDWLGTPLGVGVSLERGLVCLELASLLAGFGLSAQLLAALEQGWVGRVRLLKPSDLVLGRLPTLPGLAAVPALDLLSCEQLSNGGLARLRHFSHLRSLNLEAARLSGDSSLAQLACLPQLSRLEINRCIWSGAGLAHLAELPQLRELKLRPRDPVNPASLSALSALQGVRRIYCMGLTDEGLTHLGRATNLTELGVAGDLHGTSLSSLASLSGLRKLELWSTRPLSDWPVSLAGLSKLESLSGSSGPLSAAGLTQLASLSRLRDLRLWSVSQVPPRWLRSLGKLSQLRCLVLRQDNLRPSAADVSDLGELGQLEELELIDFPDLRDADLAPLAQLKGLRRLSLRRNLWLTGHGLAHLLGLTGLLHLVLGQCTGLTDAALAHLAGLTQLRRLTLDTCSHLTDAGLSHLTGLKRLRQLDLTHCPRLTRAGIDRLQEALPECRISTSAS